MRLIASRGIISKEGDASARFTTMLTANDYHTGNAGTKHCETNSLVLETSSGKWTRREINKYYPKCTQRSDGQCTIR